MSPTISIDSPLPKVGNRVRLRFADGTHYDADVVIAADGLRSAIRQQVTEKSFLNSALQTAWKSLGPWSANNMLEASTPRNAGVAVWRGVANYKDEPVLSEVYQIWGKGKKVGLSPFTRDSLFWFTTSNVQDDFRKRRSAEEEKRLVMELFADYPFGLGDIIQRTPADEILRNDVYDRAPLLKWSDGKVALLGDSAHPCTPDLGQGGALALEDALVLASSLATAASVEEGLEMYESKRRLRAALLTAKSRAIGQLIHIENSLVRMVRNNVFPKVFRPDGFLDHAIFDVNEFLPSAL
mmetsp:Transcript_10957/g.17927  ORF Transcript_10957/g.17927 Transcript_10957/m.17927 type:complete len:296 (+) Transcript_10957:1-888(+)